MTKHRFWLIAMFMIGGWIVRAGSQTPQAPASPEALDILQKTLAAYAGAKTYQGSWTYTLERGTVTQKVTMDIRAKAPNRLSFKMALAPGQKAVPGMEAIPETRIVIDGKTAWFENTTTREFYKVALPKNVQVSPLMYIPQFRALGEVARKDDLHVDGKTIDVIEARTEDDSTTRMEIEADTFHIRQFVRESVVGLTRITSTITFDKETFDANIPDNTFAFKPGKGVKEIPTPRDTTGLFGPDSGK